MFGAQANVLGDLAQECGGDVTARVERDRRAAAVRVTELLVRASLADLSESQSLQEGHHLARLQGRKGAQSRNPDGLYGNKLGFELRLAVLQEHADYLLQVGM